MIHIYDERPDSKNARRSRLVRGRSQGSHVQLKHPFRKGRVTVPHPRKDLPTVTVKSIERQAGVRLLPKG